MRKLSDSDSVIKKRRGTRGKVGDGVSSNAHGSLASTDKHPPLAKLLPQYENRFYSISNQYNSKTPLEWLSRT